MTPSFIPALVSGILFSLLLTACSSAPEQPGWLNDPEEEYPQVKFLSAVGQASKHESASNRALANLAKTFEVAVNEQSIDFSSSESVSIQGQTELRNEQRAARHVSTEARQVLEGAIVVEFWQDDNNQEYALAVLNKQEAASRFSRSIRKADRSISQLVNYASTDAPNPVAGLTALKMAHTVRVQRDNASRNLSVVSRPVSKGEFTADQLEALIRKSLASLQFDVQAENGELLKELQNAVNHLGIRHNPQSTTVLTGIVDAEPPEKKQRWLWLRGSYELTLSTGTTTIATKRWPVKVAAADESTLRQRAKDKINKLLPDHLFELLTSAKIK